MRVIEGVGATLALLVLCGAGCGSAPTAMVQDRPVVASAPPPPSSVSIALDRVAILVAAGTKIGVESCGGVGIGAPINWYAGDSKLELGNYRTGFNQEFAAAGYAVDTTRSLFASERKTADLVVGAAIAEMQVNRCEPALYAAALGVLALTMKRSFDATIAVDWEFFDPLDNKVVFRTRTSGQGSASQGGASYDVAMQIAFKQAARNVARDPGVRELVSKHEHQPEVTAAAQSGSGTDATMSASTASRPIAMLPLSKKPFAEGVTDIRSHVATVVTKGGHGSGFFVSEDLLITNHHVVSDERFVKIRLITGRDLAGEVLTSDARRDVALIKTERTGLKGLPLRFEDPGIGSQVFVVGTPLDMNLDSTVSAGIVSGFREIKRQRFIQSDVNIRHGNSGGPMFDDKGNVIGISDLGMADRTEGGAAGINFFIPIAEALSALHIERRSAGT